MDVLLILSSGLCDESATSIYHPSNAFTSGVTRDISAQPVFLALPFMTLPFAAGSRRTTFGIDVNELGQTMSYSSWRPFRQCLNHMPHTM